jgi:D-alanyl-D-alanine carboxypeptidase
VEVLVDPQSGRAERDKEVRAMLEGLQAGRIARERLTGNAQSYFEDTALEDYRKSLAPLGKLQALTRQGEQLRGGMTHLTYRAHFEKNTVALNIYMTTAGKFEQFLVEEVF